MITITDEEKAYKGKYRCILTVADPDDDETTWDFFSEIMELNLYSSMGSEGYGVGVANSARIETTVFTDADIKSGYLVTVSVAPLVDVAEGEEEPTPKVIGHYICENPTRNDDVISFTAYDALKYYFNFAYTPTLTGESDVNEIIDDICSNVEIEYEIVSSTATFDVSKFAGKEAKSVLAGMAYELGHNVCINEAGKLCFKSFAECSMTYSVSDCKSFELSTDVIIDEDVMYGVGSASIFDFNPFIRAGDIIKIGATDIPICELHMTYGATFMGNVESKKVDSYASSGSESISEKFEIVRNETKTVSEAQLSFSEEINNAIGMNKIVEAGKTYYANKSTLAASNYIFTMNTSGFAWTNEWKGADTVWQYGVSKDGNAILNYLTANKISADLIEAGVIKSITGEGSDGEQATVIDLNNSQIYCRGKSKESDSEGDPIYPATVIDDGVIRIGKFKNAVSTITGKNVFQMSSGWFIGDMDADASSVLGYYNNKRTLYVSAINCPLFAPFLATDTFDFGTQSISCTAGTDKDDNPLWRRLVYTDPTMTGSDGNHDIGLSWNGNNPLIRVDNSVYKLVRSGGKLEAPLTLTGGDSDTAGKIILDKNNNGQITDNSDCTLFGFSGSSQVLVNHANYNLCLRGKETRPQYNNKNLALISDVPTLTAKTATEICNGTSINSGAWAKANTIGISLSAGKYMVNVHISFDNNSTGRRIACFTSSSDSVGTVNNYNSIRSMANDGQITMLKLSTVLNVTATTNYYLWVWQNSGSALGCTAHYEYFKIS